MLKQTLVGVDVFVGGGVGRAGCVGAILRVGSVVVLRPEAMKHERGVRGALRGIGMRVAELGRPGEIEEVVVKPGA